MNREVTLENVKYGMMVDVLPNEDKGIYGLGARKVHFFNKKRFADWSTLSICKVQ